MRLIFLIYCALLFSLEFTGVASQGFDSPKFLGTSNIRPPNINQQASSVFSPEAWIQRAKDGVAPDPSISQYQGNPVMNRDGYFPNGYQEYRPNVLHHTEQEFPNGLSNDQRIPRYNGHSIPIIPIQTEKPYNIVPVNQYKLNQNFESDLINQQRFNLPPLYERPHLYDIRQSPIFNTLLKDRQSQVVSNPEAAYSNEMTITKMVPGPFIPQIYSRPGTENMAPNMFSNENKIVSPISIEEFKNPSVDPVTTKDRLLASASNPVETRIVRPPNNNIHRWISDPNIRNVLSTTKHKKRFLVIHPNGTIEHVDKLETVTKSNPNYILMRAGDISANPQLIQKPHNKISSLPKQYTTTDIKITTPSMPKQKFSSLPVNSTTPSSNEVVPTKLKSIPESLNNKTLQDSNNPAENSGMYIQTTNLDDLKNVTDMPNNKSSSLLIADTPIHNLTTIPGEFPENVTTHQNNISLMLMAPQEPMVNISKSNFLNMSATVNLEDVSNKPLSTLPITVAVNDTKQLAQPPLNIASENSTESAPNNTTLSIPVRNIPTKNTTIIPESLKNITSQQRPIIYKNNNSIASTTNAYGESLTPNLVQATANALLNNSKLAVKPVFTNLNKKFTTTIKKVPTQNITSVKVSPESYSNNTNSVPVAVISVASISVPKTTLLGDIPYNMTPDLAKIKMQGPEKKISKPIIIYGNNRTINHEEEKEPLSSMSLKQLPVIINGANITNDQKPKPPPSKNYSPHVVKNITLDPPMKDIKIPPSNDILQKVTSTTAVRNNNKLHPSPQKNPSLTLKDNQEDKSRKEVKNPLKIPEHKKDSLILPTIDSKAEGEVNSKLPTISRAPVTTVTKSGITISEIPVKVINETKNAGEPKPNNSKDILEQKLIKSSKTEEDNESKMPGSLDIAKVKTLEKPDVWVRAAGSEFFNKLIGGDGDYDVVYFFQIHNEPRVENDTTRTIYPNGTIVEEITKTIWENEEGPPVVTKTTRLLNPDKTSTSVV